MRLPQRSVMLLALLPAALGSTACGAAGPEQQILEIFFRASRLRDSAVLANVAAVSFDPRTEGTVQDFTIANISTEEPATKRVTVEAQVRNAAGQTAAKTYVFTLQPTAGNRSDGEVQESRWMITGHDTTSPPFVKAFHWSGVSFFNESDF